MIYADLFARFMVVFLILVAVVNIITEVVKSFYKFKKEEHINFFVVWLSILITLLVFVAYWQYKQMLITWYLFVAFILIGFMVAFAAMFGFDKLWKYFENINWKELLK